MDKVTYTSIFHIILQIYLQRLVYKGPYFKGNQSMAANPPKASKVTIAFETLTTLFLFPFFYYLTANYYGKVLNTGFLIIIGVVSIITSLIAVAKRTHVIAVITFFLTFLLLFTSSKILKVSEPFITTDGENMCIYTEPRSGNIDVWLNDQYLGQTDVLMKLADFNKLLSGEKEIKEVYIGKGYQNEAELWRDGENKILKTTVYVGRKHKNNDKMLPKQENSKKRLSDIFIATSENERKYINHFSIMIIYNNKEIHIISDDYDQRKLNSTKQEGK